MNKFSLLVLSLFLNSSFIYSKDKEAYKLLNENLSKVPKEDYSIFFGDYSEFIKRNNDPYHAQRWDEALQDENIKARMQKIKEKTGIEPPLSFEIKIPNNAYAVE